MLSPLQTPAEALCQDHGQHVHASEADRPYTDPDNHGRPYSNTQDLSVQPMIDRSETLQLGTDSRCIYTVGSRDLRFNLI